LYAFIIVSMCDTFSIRTADSSAETRIRYVSNPSPHNP